MAASFTKSTARNIFYGGSLFFVLVFLAMTFQTEQTISKYDNSENLTPAVVRGKKLWEVNNCGGCHTLLGEGAYFAPELGNVYTRRGAEFIKIWMKSRPTNEEWLKMRAASPDVSHRRQMPNFNLNDQQVDDMVEFLKYTNGINSGNWPPTKEG
ncbi:MAG: cytochrome c [Dyella sp.]|nr:cytochrome c [Dyella sp.]MBV8272653.1 cytochrome c [Cupriavidus sp.]